MKCLNSMVISCVMPWLVLCRKYLNLSCVIQLVVSVVNFIHSHALGHCQPCEFLSKREVQYRDLPCTQESEYFTGIEFYCTCLSSGLRLNFSKQEEPFSAAMGHCTFWKLICLC